MQYMLLVHADENAWGKLSKAQQEQGVAAYWAYDETLKNAGVLRSDNRLQPSSASSTVKIRDGKTKVMNGPYAESKEQIGGYYIIEVADVDAALSWAAKCPGAQHGTMEVRPVWARS